jgi:LPXTG-motif cell wall-anchored protein
MLLAIGTYGRYNVPRASGVGIANIVVTSVYWGSNPMDPTTAHPGDVNDQISIVLSNVGDDIARGVNATLTLGPPLTYGYYQNGIQYSASSVSKIAGDIEAGKDFTVGYTVSVDSNAKEGIYRYDLQLNYKSARELQQISNDVMIDVPLWRGELHVQSVLTLPTKVYPDSKQVLLKVGIVNSGRGAAKDIELRLALRPPFTASSSSSDRIYIGNVPAGQTTEGDFIIDVAPDATFGQYSIILGEQVGNQILPVDEISLFINEKVKFDIISVTPNQVSAGDSGRVIKVELKNDGSVKADSVRVQMRVGNFFTGTLTDFLGTMLAGETKVAFFTVDIDGKAESKQYNFDFRIDWTQEDNSLNDTLNLVLFVVPPGAPVTLIAIGLIVLIGAGGYFFFRRRRMKAAQATSK